MFIKRTTKKLANGKTYVNHLLVESVATPKGPRHRVLCSLGALAPGPREEWLSMARRLGAALSGQASLIPDPGVEAVAESVTPARRPARTRPRSGESDLLAIHTDRVGVERVREAGPVHVAHQIWNRLELDDILAKADFTSAARTLTQILTINRLVSPCSEHALPDWARRSAVADLLGVDLEQLSDDHLYRHLDALHPKRARIEAALVDRERTLFNLAETLFLYDLTSSYFEGQCAANPKAKRGYSRDHRPDCKQVVVGLALDSDGFPKAHEVFDGNTIDRTSVATMLDRLEARTGKKGSATVVVDRGMAYAETLAEITSRGYHYIVAGQPSERTPYLDEFEEEGGWEEVVREPSPRNPFQKKSSVRIKRAATKAANGETHLLCKSEGRVEKDRAIREKQEKRLVVDLGKLAERVAKRRLVAEAKIHEAIGRLKQRYPRVARYYAIRYDAQQHRLVWSEDEAKKEKAKTLDGGYLIRTDRTDMTDEEVWRTYMLLTRVENAFRDMKGPLMERPIFHQLQRRVETHIFVCVLAYHLLVCIEKKFLDAGVHTSWETVREQLSTHQIVTVVLPTHTGATLRIRMGSTPEPAHQEIYQVLGIPDTLMSPVRTWDRDRDEKRLPSANLKDL